MCQICRQYPCDPRCPNAPEPTPVLTCIECGDGIYPGDRYLDAAQGPICEDCTVSFTVEEFMERAEVEFSTAKETEL